MLGLLSRRRRRPAPTGAHSAPAAVARFTATLYFADEPNLTARRLFDAWGRDGRTCEWAEKHSITDVFAGLRGSAFVRVGAEQEAHPEVFRDACPDYPALTEAGSDPGATFCIDPGAAWTDVGQARRQLELEFRMRTAGEHPTVAHNEFVATLWGIHQVAPLQAVWLHELGVLVGRNDLDEYLAYADSTRTDGTRARFAPMLAFGSFVRDDGGTVTAWTTGLGHFGHPDVWVRERATDPAAARTLLFGVGYMVTGGRRFRPGDTVECHGVDWRFVDDRIPAGEPRLRLIR